MKLIQTANRYLDLDFSTLKDLSEIEAGQGAGKTTGLNSLRPLSVLLVSSSNSLLKQIRTRMPEMDWQMHNDENKYALKGEALAKYLEAKHCLCNLQSLHLWEGAKRTFDVFAIEEADLFFKSLYLYRPQTNVPSIKNHSQLVWRMKSTPSVICIGAHSTGYIKGFNERNLHRDHTFHQNIYPDLEGKELIGCDKGAQLKTLIEEQLELRLSDRATHGGVFIPTEYKAHLRTMLEGWVERFPTLRARIVTADNPLSESELGTLASETEETGWDLLLASPSLRDGFHIMNEFDLTAGDYARSFNAILTLDEILNAMLRVRTCKRFAIHIRDTKTLEKESNSNAILEKQSSIFLESPKHLLITNTDTGELEVSNADQLIGDKFWTEYQAEETQGIKQKLGIIWERRGGIFSLAPLKVSKTVATYKRQDRMMSVLQAKPIRASEWGQAKNEFREIHTEILSIFGEVTETTYTRWDNGNYKDNIERSLRLFNADRVKTNDSFEDSKIEVDICTEKFIKKLQTLMIDNKYIVHEQVFQRWAMWNELKANRERWNELCRRIGLADCEIQGRHTNLQTHACLEWFAVLLRKYDFQVDCVEPKSQKAKDLRSEAEKGYKPRLEQWKLEDNKHGNLQRFFWDKLVKKELSLESISTNALKFLNCYSHIVVSKQQLSRRNSIT